MIRRDRILFNILGGLFIGSIALICLLPIIMVITGSFTSQQAIIKDGYKLIPAQISFEAYQIIFESPAKVLKAYSVTGFVTLAGTLLGLFITAMTGYVLSCKEFKYRNYFSFFFYFTTIFSGGLVPWYILIVRYLHLKNSILALIIPMLLNVIFIFIMKSFMSSIPDSIRESAMIDGAGDFRIFISLIIPLSKPVLATIGLFIALNYWNDWFMALMFMDKDQLYPLQFFLYSILSKMDFINAAAAQSGIPIPSMPSEAYKLAMTVVATGPIIFLYPFVQKYFVKGITLGSIKG